VSIHEVNNAGGVLQYWEKLVATRPHLARMALDFLSAPGESSVRHLVTDRLPYSAVSVIR